MSFSAQKATPFEVSNEALNKIVNLKTNEGAKFFRVYVTGGGCSGFQYGFKFDEYDEDEDTKLDFDQNVCYKSYENLQSFLRLYLIK